MKLSKQQVEHVAKLARLGITEKEKEKFQKELSAILGFVEKLNEADIEGVEPAAHITGLENVLREDEEKGKRTRDKKLIGMASQTKDGYIKVEAVFEENSDPNNPN